MKRFTLMVIAFVAMLALLCSLTGCSSEEYVDCELDVTLTTHQRIESERAVEAWRGFASERSPRVIEGGEWLVLVAQVPGGWLGYAQGKRRLIRIDPDTPEDEVFAVVLHELGHALGLQHVRRGVMDPTRQTVVFSDEDGAECQRAGACE